VDVVQDLVTGGVGALFGDQSIIPVRGQLTRMIPQAVRLSNGYIAVPTSTYNLQMLRYLGMPTLPPLEVNGYDYPGKYTPFEAQRITANFLVVNPRSFVLSDMGTGKKLSALWAADRGMWEAAHYRWEEVSCDPTPVMGRGYVASIALHGYAGTYSRVARSIPLVASRRKPMPRCSR